MAKHGDSSVARLGDHLGYWLRLVSNHVSASFARKVEREGVTVAEWVVMRKLFEVESAAGIEVAAGLSMTRGTVSKLFGRLEEKGMIWRKESKVDARRENVGLTEKGRKLVPKLAALADENEEQWFGGLSAKEQKDLGRVLRKLAAERGLEGEPVE